MFFIHSSADKHFGHFHIFTTVNNAAMNSVVQKFISQVLEVWDQYANGEVLVKALFWVADNWLPAASLHGRRGPSEPLDRQEFSWTWAKWDWSWFTGLLKTMHLDSRLVGLSLGALTMSLQVDRWAGRTAPGSWLGGAEASLQYHFKICSWAEACMPTSKSTDGCVSCGSLSGQDCSLTMAKRD